MLHFPSRLAPTSMVNDGDSIFPIILLFGRSSTFFEAIIFPFTSPSQITVPAFISASIFPSSVIMRMSLVFIWPIKVPSMHKVP